MSERIGRDAGIFLAAGLCGIASGMFGIGGGVLLVPLLGLLFSFSQHRAPGVFLGGIVGGKLAERLQPRRMRQVFGGILFALGAWQAFSAWWR